MPEDFDGNTWRWLNGGIFLVYVPLCSGAVVHCCKLLEWSRGEESIHSRQGAVLPTSPGSTFTVEQHPL